MLFKNTYHKAKSSLFIVILLLLGTAVWNQAYLESQNFLLKNPNWYSYRSTFIDNFATTYQITMSRIALSAGELNLRTSKRSDMILNRHKVILKDLEFTFMIPNNSHLDLLYNFKDGASSFFRLSRSSLHESGMYKIDTRGVYTQFHKIDFTLNSENRHRGHLRQTDKGIVFSVDDKVVGQSLGEKFENLEFGFETGEVGVLISDIKAFDINGVSIGTSLDNNSGWFKYYLKNLLIGFVFLTAIFIIAISLKKNGQKAVLSSLQFATLLGILWLVYDFYYYSKKPTHWDRIVGTTRFYTTPKEDIDFEVIRWHIFSSWARLLRDKPVEQVDYEKRFGVAYDNYPLNYCLNKECSSFDEKDKVEGRDANKKTIRLGLIGLSTTDSTGVRPGQSSTFIEMHKSFYEKNNEKINIESYNFSHPALYFKSHRDKFIENLSKNKIDVVVIVLKIGYSTSQSEFQAFGDFLKKCKELGIKTIFVNEINNPEKVVYLTQKQVKDILKVDLLNHESHNKITYPIFDRYRKYDLTVVEPEEVFFNLKNIRIGKIWWDYGHLTPYGHEIFGKWIGSKIGPVVGNINE